MTPVLIDVEYGMDLPSPRLAHIWVSVKGDAEATFSVHESHDPMRIELKPRPHSFLLIVRTGRIVTAHRPAPYEEGVTMNEYRRILGVSSIQPDFATASKLTVIVPELPMSP